MKYRAVTANCGNGAFGKIASQTIASSLLKDNVDFCVINCQEVNVAKTMRQLQHAVGKGYTVECLGRMATHTKLATQFHSHTGLATFIIYKNDLTVTPKSVILARRNPRRLDGSGYNKGGLITEFIVIKGTDLTKEHVHVQTVSGHLDSNKVEKRIKDWHCINNALSQEVQTWAALVAVCPHLRLSGYDANTRNRLTQQGDAVNLWQHNPHDPELQALYQAAIAGQHFSAKSTYKTNIDDIIATKDNTRPGYARGGMLDFVGVADGSVSSEEVVLSGNSDIILVDQSDSARDHAIIMSPLQDHVPQGDFDKVKGQIAQRLEHNAPHLAREIRLLEDSEKNQKTLLLIYQLFLSPQGMLNQAISLHIEKLGFLNKSNPELRHNELIVNTLFPSLSWFDAARIKNLKQFVKQYKQEKELIGLLMSSLNPCPEVSETEQRINLYAEQRHTISQQHFHREQARQAFKEMQINQYNTLYSRLTHTLASYRTDTPDKEMLLQKGKEILTHVKTIIPNNEKIKRLSLEEIGQINSILKHCSDAINTLNQGGDIGPIVSELSLVAHTISGKTSSGWKTLGACLLIFAGAALVVAGLLAAIPSGGASVLFTAIGAAVMGAGAAIADDKELDDKVENQLAKSIVEYKTALQNLTTDEPLILDNGPSTLP